MALAAGLGVFGYLGWDGALWDPRLQLLLHLIAVGVVAALGLWALTGRPLPRAPIDLPVLGLLAAFALATATAVNPGMSLRAMASITAFAAMLPAALIALRLRPSWVGAVTAVPVLLLSVPTLGVLLLRRIEWIVVGAPGLPPIRLPAEGSPFGSVAVPPFVIWPAFVLAGLIEAPRWRRAAQLGLVLVGVPLTLLSGSRSAWLALAVTLGGAGAAWAWRRRGALRPAGRIGPRAILIGVSGLVVVAGVALLVGPRLTAVTSLIYRASLWRDTLAAWSSDPLSGIGPGFMPYARQAAAPDFSFPVRQPHSHNLPLGVLGDAGLIGLATALILVAILAWVAGPWRARTRLGRQAGWLLIGLAVGGLFEDLTFIPGFVLLVIALVAVALTDAGAVAWVRPKPGRLRLGSVAAAAMAFVLLATMVVADGGAIAYRAGSDAAARDAWSTSAERFARAVQIDPWHPAGPKALAVAADAAGDTELARVAAERAVELNPGDAPSWINLALLCRELGDAACQAGATERAVATAAFLESELVNAAFSYESLNRPDDADAAYRRSLLSQRLTQFATSWPRDLAIGDATLDESFGALFELNLVLAQRAAGEAIDPAAFDDPAVRALAHALRGERDEADRWIETAIDADPADIAAWDLAVVLRDHWGRSTEREREVAAVVRGRPFPDRDAEASLPSVSFDIATFRAVPRDGYVRSAIRLRPAPPYPWALQAILP